MAKKIAELLVSIQAETASLSKGLSDANAKVDRFAGQFQSAMKLIGGATGVGLVVKSLAGMVKSSIDTGDAIFKLSQRTGIATTTLSALSHAGRLSDVSMEQLGTSLGQLSRQMFDAAAGSGESKRAFELLGVAVSRSDGSLRDTKQVLFELADAFSIMPPGATKSALAMQVFGKAGGQMIPLLNQGSAGLKKMTDEAERFGLVFDKKTAAAAEKFNDALTRLDARIEGVKNKLASFTLSALETVEETPFSLRQMGAEEMRRSQVERMIRHDVVPREFLAGQVERTGAAGIALTMQLKAAIKAANDEAGRLEHKRAMEEAAKAAEKFRGVLAAANAEMLKARADLDLALLGPRGVFGFGGQDLPPVPFGAPGTIPTASLSEVSFATELRDWNAEAQKVRDSLRTVGEAAQMDAGHLRELFQAGVINAGEFNLGIGRIKESMTGFGEETRQTFRAFESFGQTAIGGLIQQLAGLGGSWRGFAAQVISDLGRIIQRMLVMQNISAAGGGGGGGGFLSGLLGFGLKALTGGLFGGGGFSFAGGIPLNLNRTGGIPLSGRQHGGPVQPGGSYLLGEGGMAERLTLFPGGGGYVTPLGGRGGESGMVVHVHQDNRGADIGTAARMASLVSGEMFRAGLREVIERMNRTV